MSMIDLERAVPSARGGGWSRVNTSEVNDAEPTNESSRVARVGRFVLQELFLVTLSSSIGAIMGLSSSLLLTEPPRSWENPGGKPVPTVSIEDRRSLAKTAAVVGAIIGALIYIAKRIKDSCR